MNRISSLVACAAVAAVFAVDAAPNPAGRPMGLDRAITHMSPQGLANQQGTLHANPASRGILPTAPAPTAPPTPPVVATPATPAVPATPATPAAPGTPASPAVPATPAVPAVPAVPPTYPTPHSPGG